MKKTIVLAILGTVLEYYDYSLYGFLALEISQTFFAPDIPKDNALLLSLLVFSCGTVAKILGATIFSNLSDKKGRSFSLKFNIFGMSLATLGIGILPAYQIIGTFSLIGLIFLRMIQGFFVGGEYDTVTVYIYEKIGKNRPCLANSLICIAVGIGAFLASCVSMMCKTHFPDSWRLTFLIGGFAGLLVALLRRYINETDIFLKLSSTETKISLLEVIYNNPYKIFRAIIFCGVVGGSYQFCFIFLKNFIELIDPPSKNFLGHYFNLFLLLYMIFCLVAGIASDKYGFNKVLKFSFFMIFIVCITMIILPYKIFPLFYMSLQEFF